MSDLNRRIHGSCAANGAACWILVFGRSSSILIVVELLPEANTGKPACVGLVLPSWGGLLQFTIHPVSQKLSHPQTWEEQSDRLTFADTRAVYPLDQLRYCVQIFVLLIVHSEEAGHVWVRILVEEVNEMAALVVVVGSASLIGNPLRTLEHSAPS